MTLRMYATRKGLPLHDIAVDLRHDRVYDEDCAACDEKPMRIEVLERRITLTGELTAAQRERLLEIADRCPVHRTLHGPLQVRSELAIEDAG